MMSLDSATSIFLAWLVVKSLERKLKVQNSKEKFPHFAVKKCSKPLFVSRVVLPCNPSARLKKFRWPVMIVKLRKEQKYSKILKTIGIFNTILLKFVILIFSEPFHFLKRQSSFPIASLNQIYWLIKIHKLGTLPKHIAHKMVIECTYFFQKTFINFNEPQL